MSIFTSKGVVLLQVFSKLMEKVNKKSNKNLILVSSEKLIYFLKFVE